MKIKTKIQLFATIWILILLVIINSAIYSLFLKMSTDTELARVKEQTEMIVATLYGDEDQAEISADLLKAYVPAHGMIRVIDKQNDSLLTMTKEAHFANLPKSFKPYENETVYETDDGQRYASVSFPIIWTDGTVVTLEVTESLEAIQENMHTLRNVLLFASLFVFIPFIIGGRLLSHLMLKPITSMIETMQDIQQRGVFKRIRLHRETKDELSKLANTFNQMIDRLENNFAKQQQFVSDASHELKTPLTIIESYSNMLKRWGMEKRDVLEEAIEAISTESGRMKKLIEQMLALAKDESEGELHLQKVDLVHLCRQVSQPFERIYERPVDIQNTEIDIFVLADEQKLKQVLYIVLDNALKYSDQSVRLEIGRETDFALLKVIDQGMGIPEKDLPHIFDRFYRVDKARSRETGGAGLGLSIAHRIIQAHHGKIDVQSEEGRGTTFVIRLPLLHPMS